MFPVEEHFHFLVASKLIKDYKRVLDETKYARNHSGHHSHSRDNSGHHFRDRSETPPMLVRKAERPAPNGRIRIAPRVIVAVGLGLVLAAGTGVGIWAWAMIGGNPTDEVNLR